MDKNKIHNRQADSQTKRHNCIFTTGKNLPNVCHSTRKVWWGRVFFAGLAGSLRCHSWLSCWLPSHMIRYMHSTGWFPSCSFWSVLGDLTKKEICSEAMSPARKPRCRVQRSTSELQGSLIELGNLEVIGALACIFEMKTTRIVETNQ